MNICVLGTGYVGLVSGVCFAKIGHKVTCVDIDSDKISKLNKGISPIFEVGLEEIIAQEKDTNLFFSTDIEKAIRENDFVFIAVGTPPKENGDANLEYIFDCAEIISRNLNNNKIIITKSTVPVGTGKQIEEIISKNKGNEGKFEVCSNPEFLREGNAVYDFLNPDRVIVGTATKEAADKIYELYDPIVRKNGCEFFKTNVETAELTKYASNAFLATKITFINEMANLCEKAGADIADVAYGMGLDQRIGKEFLMAGPGYGGSCFPKDTNAVAFLGEKFIVRKIYRSHKHAFKGKAKKRRTISVYAEKDY